MVISTSRSSSGSRSTRSAITSCTVCETGTSRPAPSASGATVHSPVASSLREHALGEHGLEQLDEIERIAGGDPVQPGGEPPAAVGRARWPISRISSQTSSSVSVADRDDVGVRLGPEHPAEPRRRRVALDLARREHADPEHRGLLQPAGEEPEQLAAVLVAPLQIVDGDRRPAAPAASEASSCATPSNSRHPSPGSASAGESAGNRSRSSGTRRATSASHSGAVPASPGAASASAQRLDHGLVGNPGPAVVASAAQHGAAVGDDPAEELVGQPGLAHAGLAFDQDDLPVAPARPLPGGRSAASTAAPGR